tara:strand:- start:3289 stop:8613 length:5325 start_codon:yes stop_codon:yes gene_type:complete
MKIKVYRTLNKKDPGDAIVSMFQIPITFIKEPKKIKPISDEYFEILLETSNKQYQNTPPFHKKSYSFIHTIKNKLEQKINKIDGMLVSETDIFNIAVFKLENMNYYSKLMDICPSLEILDKITMLVTFFTDNYSSIDGLSEFKKYWSVFSPIIKVKLLDIGQRLEGLIILDNYDRLNLEDIPEEFPEGYVLNNRISFSKFMKKFSDKSMIIPPRIIKNYGLVKPDKAILHNITLSNQQKFVSDYLNDNTPYRGLLLYHGLGSGKSGASIAITNGYKNKKIVILLPASLKINYLQEIERFGESLFKPHLNWEFFNLENETMFQRYNWVNDNIVNRLPYLDSATLEFNQTKYKKYLVYKENNLGDIEDQIIAKFIINTSQSLQNSLFVMLENLGVSHELLEKIITKYAGSDGIWLLNNKFKAGDIIQHKLDKTLYKIIKIENEQMYLSNINPDQVGGGFCSLCKAPGTTSRTCPLKEGVKNPNFEKHPEAAKMLASATAIGAPEEATKDAAQTVEEVSKIITDMDMAVFPSPKIVSVEEVPTETGTVDSIVSLAQIENYLHYVIKNDFSDLDKSNICKQIKEAFKYKYHLCSYNAGAYTVINILKNLIPNFKQLVGDKTSSQITVDDINSIMFKINNGEIANPFNDKVVVIDEIHNLISLIMPNSESVNFNGGIIFELLVRAENVRIVGLSGTPSINDVFEFSILYNILKGLIKSFEFQLSSKDTLVSLDDTEVVKFLENYKSIDRFDLQKNTLKVTRIPRGFIKKIVEGEYVGVIKNKLNDFSDKEFIHNLVEDFKKIFPNYLIEYKTIGVHAIFNTIIDTSHSWKERLLGDGQFITDQIQLFKDAYIDQEDNVMFSRNFKNNITGMTSFYNERQRDNEGNSIFPEVEKEDKLLDFSMYQFMKYCNEREEERKKEKISRLDKFIKGSANIKASFKTATRQLSIFAFPPDITRVTKKNKYDMEYIMNEIEKLLNLSASGVDILSYKTPTHEKIVNKIKSLYKLKINFLEKLLTTEFIKSFTKDNTFDPDLLLMNYIKNSIKLPATETSPQKNIDILSLKIRININPDSFDEFTELDTLVDKNKDYLMRLCSTISELCEVHQDLIKKNSNIDAELSLIKTELNRFYLSYNLESDKKDIFNDITIDEEYEELLQHQISRLIESDVYLDFHALVSNEPYNLSWLSPKYVEIFKNIITTPGSVFVYSQFLTAEGIRIFTEVLKKNGFEELNWSRKLLELTDNAEEIKEWCTITSNKRINVGEFNITNELHPGNLIRWTKANDDGKIISTTHRVVSVSPTEIYLTKNCDMEIMYQDRDFSQFKKTDLVKVTQSNFSKLSRCRYVLWTGKQTDIQERIDILKRFNGIDNKYGQECLILLATSSGAEGISLANVRQVHIMEPYWNNVRTNQVIGRARRVRSHIALDEEDRNVKVFAYMCKFSNAQLETITPEQLNSPEILQLVADINSLDTSDTKNTDKSYAESIDYFMRLIGKYTYEINHSDKGKSTDEYLTLIASRKERLLNKFLYLIKESAVDCVLNLNENKTSDPLNLGELECHSPDLIIDNLRDEKGYIYKFNPLIKATYTLDGDIQKERQTIRDASVKYQVIKFTLNNSELELNNVNLKCIVFPLKSKKEIVNNAILYNYYSFFSINFIEEGKKLQIGKFVDSNLEFNVNFLQYVKIFSLIDDCEEEVKTEHPEFNGNFLDNEVSLSKYRELVRTCYLQKIKLPEIDEDVEESDTDDEDLKPVMGSDEWVCPLCDTVNANTNEECSNEECDMEFEDL